MSPLTISRIIKYSKKITGIQDYLLFFKNVKKRVGQIFYHKKYTADDIVQVMQSMGMKVGSSVCIHSSMKEFYNYVGTPMELINKILDVIGDNGTLIMPAYPEYTLMNSPNYIFNKNIDKTGAGLLAETFRQMPGVIRSINVQHSVCAYGKYATWLTKDHEKCYDCWDENSPWRRMIDLGTIVFNLGLPRTYIGTFWHCVESTLRVENPYWAQFFSDKVVYSYYDEDGLVRNYCSHTSNIERRTRKRKVLKYFTEEDWQIKKISNLEIKAFYTKHCFTKMIELGRKGITMYYIPSPKKYF
jgi:aminoglycoside 3-N-acetyltransferase